MEQRSTHRGRPKKEPMSNIRKSYMLRLVGRCIVFLICAGLWLWRPEEFDILRGWAFFDRFSILHLLWGIWILDMFFQLVPVAKKISLGSQKLFRHRFRPIREKINQQALKQYIAATTKAAYKVMLLWIALGAVIALLYFSGVISRAVLFMITVAFYVCDLICVLIWCPFRLMLKNRCCTTCRIFNWDHLMMFTPMFFVPGVYSWSLALLALVVWCVWELCVLIYPERFWEYSNDALKCVNCTDKLCTQYCQKLRPRD